MKNYHHENFKDRTKRYKKLFRFSKKKQRKLLHIILDVIKKSKTYHKKGRIQKKSIPLEETFVSYNKLFRPQGVYYAIDFGGTNVRCIRCEFKEHNHEKDFISTDLRTLKLRNLKYGYLDEKATATELFDLIADLLLLLMKKHDEDKLADPMPVGFTFSFEFNSLSISSAQCLKMSKGWNTGNDTLDPVISSNVDIGLLLNQAFKRKKVSAFVSAILNDTTGTLISGFTNFIRKKKDCVVGAIIGTGFNICYVDLTAKEFNFKGDIINTEIGCLHHHLNRNILDHEIDYNSENNNAHLFEKMISGLYISELCRLLLLRVFQNESPKLLYCRNSMTTAACFAIAYDNTTFELTKEILINQLEWSEKKLTEKILRVISELCHVVCKRSAKLAATAIAAISHCTGRLQFASGGLTVAIDGSIYVKNKIYQKEVKSCIQNLLDSDLANLIDFQIALDGSGLGAAALSACVSNYAKN